MASLERIRSHQVALEITRMNKSCEVSHFIERASDIPVAATQACILCKALVVLPSAFPLFWLCFLSLLPKQLLMLPMAFSFFDLKGPAWRWKWALHERRKWPLYSANEISSKKSAEPLSLFAALLMGRFCFKLADIIWDLD